MRQIKFRIWDKKNKEWLFDYKEIGGFNLFGEITLVEGFNCLQMDELNDLEVQQFTGLLDKNGKEIYEGDIVQGSDKQPNIVFWFSEKGMWGLDQKDVPHDLLAEFNEEMEVIGNIYENPDLITSRN